MQTSTRLATVRRRAQTTCLALGVAALSATAAAAARIDDCAAGDPDIARAVSLFYDEAQFERALDTVRGLDLSSLDPVCRAEVRDLRAQIFVSMGDRESALSEYRALLEELPTFQPEPGGMTERSLLEEARASRPIRVTITPESLELRGDREDGELVRTLTLASADGRAFTWSLQTPPSWLSVTPRNGTAASGAAEVRVTPGPGASDVVGAAAAALVFTIDGAREQRIPVTLVTPSDEDGSSILRTVAIVAGVAAAGVGGYLLFKGDEKNGEQEPDRLDPNPPPPPGLGPIAWILRW